MEDNDKQVKPTFSKQGAWLGLIAYLVVAILIAAIYIFG